MTDNQKYYILRCVPNLFFEYYYYWTAKRNLSFENVINNSDNVYIFMACDYSNLGDYAITVAQKEILLEMYPNRKIHVINMKDTFSKLKSIDNTNDIITIIGGGNMGDLYYGYERKRNFIVKFLHGYNIISFPQSVYFSNSKLGRFAKKRSIKEYSKHNKLTIYAREKLSYNLMRNLFTNNKIKLSPDIVFTLDYRKNLNRKGIVISIREDKESILTKENRQYLLESLKIYQTTFLNTTTIKNPQNIGLDFEHLINSYSTAELIITDRLHGMIIAYITGTPAIVIPNNNGKVISSYEWIKDCDFIKLIDINDLPYINKHIENIKKKVCNDIYFEKKNREFKSYFLQSCR